MNGVVHNDYGNGAYNAYNIDWCRVLSPFDADNNLDHIFLIKIFDYNRKIAECRVFQERVWLHQLYRWCISAVLMPIIIPLMFISFLYSVIKAVMIFLFSVVIIVGRIPLVIIKETRHFSRYSFFKLMRAFGLVLIVPLFFLCQIGSSINRHVMHGFRFYRYVGSSNKNSGVLFHDDTCICNRWEKSLEFAIDEEIRVLSE